MKATGLEGDFGVAARCLVDAGGRQPWPGRPASRRHVFDRLVSIAGYLMRDPASDPDRRAWVEAAPGGWWYTAPLGGLLIAAYFTDSDLVRAQRARQEDGWFNLAAPCTARRMKGARLVGKLRIFPAASSIASPLAGSDWVVVRDAACAHDPLSGRGVCHALASGLLAADLIPILDTESGMHLVRYCEEIAEQFSSYLRTRQSFYLQECGRLTQCSGGDSRKTLPELQTK